MRPVRIQLGLIALAGLAARIVYDIRFRDYQVLGDAQTFHQVADHLAHGSGFVEPFSLAGAPTAEHPPAWEVVLAALDLVGADGYLTHRLAGALIGTVTVVLVGLLAQRLTGDRRAALVAAAVAAAYPVLITADGALMSETLYGAFVVAALLAAVWAREGRADGASARRFAVLGALLGLAALTRGEALGLLVLLVVPLAWKRPGGWVRFGAAVLAAALVLAPWTVRNLVTFDTPVLISTNANGLFVGANCPAVYRGPLLGSWRFQCYTDRGPGEDEAAYFQRQRGIGLRYARDHAGRLPVVLAARELRLFDVWRTDQAVFLNAQEGRPAGPVRWMVRSAWVVMALALAGAVIIVRRGGQRAALVVLLSPVVLVVLVAAASYGTTRFRHAAEPGFCVLAGIALSAAGGRIQARRAGLAQPAPAPPAAVR